MKIIVHGYTGRMGQTICRLADEGFAGAAISARVSVDCPNPGENGCYTKLTDFTGEADCVVDFSHHAATNALLDYCVSHHLPAIIATTGQTEQEKAAIVEAAKQIPVFFSANYSLGIAVLAELAQKAAAMFPDADIEIVETHHNQKLDVPSGTALLLANGIKAVRPEAEFVIGRHENGKRTKQQIGIHSLRLGSETGTHEILISTGSETLTLTHRAENRALFAEGALRAASWLMGKPAGLYAMRDLIGG